MGVFFQELAKKLAERWVTLLLIPGALFLAVAGIGVESGQRHALDYIRTRDAITDLTASIARQYAGTQAVTVLAVLLAAAGVGLAVQALAGVTRAIWLGSWPRPLALPRRWRVRRRRTRWLELVGERRDLERAHPHGSRTADQQRRIDAAAERVNNMAMAEPGRPTWMGDRVHALESVALHRYGVDLAFSWPRLWLTLSDPSRSEITSATAAFASAVATGTWALAYLALGVLWWPAALVAIVVGATGWVRARAAITNLTTLSEAALDLHGRALAIELGVAEPGRTGPLTVAEGREITRIARKGR
ncbi:hypothetical protein [Nocardia arizonensis]|uniref:hypothetical protein n=1 Tax=Nocardia arizonensis TaxID=1141647 RepID=UPI0006D15D48|nr:hypothetical protein [Nocardia arizonensis]